MASSTSSTYFQGGDYVELLSAQGKAPAATWKLHGKILKSFEKAIKGNAFQLDGSTETKMQLPKTMTTQSLGLSQRFIVFQLSIPFARSFAIEIGFSDFQKIRRRFVFASAFRETAMTSLHVQIPFDARVTRDQWVNLVFDLQALTETYFAGSTFRSMESICISGSCKLKRVFTMKDAPALDLMARQQQTTNGKLAQRGQVAGYADMKNIPKQFLFSSGGPGPIPTEYFIVATTSNAAAGSHGEARDSGHHTTSSTSSKSGGGRANGSLTGQARGKSAPLGVQKQKPLLAKKTSATRPVSSSIAISRLGTAVTPRASAQVEIQAASPPPSPPAVLNQSRRSLTSSSHSVSSSSYQLSPGRPGSPVGSLHQISPSRLPHGQQSPTKTSVSSYRRGGEQQEDHLLQPGHDARPHSSTRKKRAGSQKHSPRNPLSDDDELMVPPPRPSLLSSLVAEEPRQAPRSSSMLKTSKEMHRRAIIAEIQQKLDILSDDDELEAERNTHMFLERTSIDPPDSPEALPVRATRHLSERAQDDEEFTSGTSFQRYRQISGGPRKLQTNSIFAFADESGSEEGAGDTSDTMAERITKLFDFGSLLNSPTSKSQDVVTISDTSAAREQVLRKSSLSSASLKMRDEDSVKPRVVVSAQWKGSSVSDDEDLALAQLLIAKRNARRHQQLITVSPAKKREPPMEVSRDSQGDQHRLSVDDLTKEDAQDEELNGVSEIQFTAEVGSYIKESTTIDSSSEDGGAQDEEEENLSIDLTGDLDGDGEEKKASASAQSSEVERVDVDNDDKSFDFDDLVDDQDDEDDDRVEVETRQPRNQATPSSTIVDSTSSSDQRGSSRAGARKQQHKQDDEVAFSVSSPHKSLSASSHHSANELSFSSSHRLVSLLESTDWSYLPGTSLSYGEKNAMQTQPSGSPDGDDKSGISRFREPPTTFKTAKAPATASIELIYDPLLNCYFDPVANKYYALASE